MREAMSKVIAQRSDYKRAIAHVVIPSRIQSLPPIYHRAYEFLHTSSDAEALSKHFNINKVAAGNMINTLRNTLGRLPIPITEKHLQPPLAVAGFHEAAFQSLRIGRKTKISFHRTLRIPEDGKDYPLPASLGTLPIHRVEDFAATVPEDSKGADSLFRFFNVRRCSFSLRDNIRARRFRKSVWGELTPLLASPTPIVSQITNRTM